MVNYEQVMNKEVAQQMPAQEQGAVVQQDSTKKSERLFVTKIPREVTEDELKEYFEQFGTVSDFHMPKIPGKFGHKGIAFISYEDPITAQTVREAGGHSLRNQSLVVDHATPRNPALSAQRKADSQRQMQGQRRDGMDELYSYMMGGSRNQNVYEEAESYYRAAPARQQQSYDRNRVFVTKIGSTITKDNLIEYFSQFGSLADCYVPISNNPSQPHKGIAFVSFRDPRIAEEVLKRPSYEIKPGQFIVVDKANERMGGNQGNRSAPY